MPIFKSNIKAGINVSVLSFIAVGVASASQPVESNNNPTVKQDVELRDLLHEVDPRERYIVTFQETQHNTHVASPQSKLELYRSLMPTTSQAVENGKLNKVNAQELLTALGAKPVKVLDKHNMIAATMNKKTLNALRNNPQVSNVSVDPRRQVMAQTTPYGIGMVQGDLLAQNNTSARKVCVIDTGYNLGHPDLPDQNGGVTGQANNSQVGNWYNDGNGHGTHVAGTIAALANNQGVVGVYPGVDLHIVKIFDDNGLWTYASDIIDGISQCQQAGANVVNMSLGGGTSSTAEQNAMQNFTEQGVMLVAAAGNDGNSSLSYPASYDSVISVAAVDSGENHASYSQYNAQVEIAGPGTGVNSTWPTNTYNSISGTSMATPHVAGVAALVWSFFPQCSNQQIRSALNETAKDKGAAGRDNFYGFGLVKARDAYDYLNTFGCNGDTGGGTGGPGTVEPVSGSLSDLSGSRNSWKRYTWDIPAGVAQMTISISGGSGDADLYLNFGSQPSTSNYDCRPYESGNNETCTVTNPSDGTWHIGIRGYTSYNNLTLNYSYQ